MAVELTYNPVQLVQPNQPVLLNTAIACRCGQVLHRNESGIATLRGVTCSPCINSVARYQVTFNGNIAVPDDGTVDPIAVALAIDGEPILTSRAVVTPAAVDDYFNVTCTDIVAVPKGCCFNVSCINVTDGQAINVQNSNMTISRLA